MQHSLRNPDTPALRHAGAPPPTAGLCIAALAVIAGVVLFYELGDFRTFGSHEVLAAVPARGMLESGNWVVPYYGSVPRLEKPPLCYWVIAASGWIFGEVNEWTARLPAAVSAVLMTALMGLWAARWYGRMAGFGAALVQITSVYAVTFARKAEVDMLLCLLTTSAMFLVVEQRADESRRGTFLRWTGIYALLAIAWMAKFHYGAVMVLAPTVLYLFVQKRRRALVALANPAGLALLAAAVFVWPYLLLQHVPHAWEIWEDETLGRVVGELGHMPWWFYLPHILWLPLPWTPLAFAAMPSSWRRAWRGGNPREQFLWIWMATQFAIVHLSANKHKHYLLSLLPVFSLLAGQTFALLAARVRQGKPLVTRPWAVSHTTGLVGTAVVAGLIISRKWPDQVGPAIAIGLMLALGGSAAVWLLAARRTAAACLVATCSFLGCHVAAVGWIVPGRDHRLAPARFAQAQRRGLAEGRTICTYRMGVAPEVFYLDDPVVRLESAEAAAVRLAGARQLHIVTWDYLADELAEIGQARIIARMPVESDLPASKRPPLVVVELLRPSRLAN